MDRGGFTICSTATWYKWRLAAMDDQGQITQFRRVTFSSASNDGQGHGEKPGWAGNRWVHSIQFLNVEHWWTHSIQLFLPQTVNGKSHFFTQKCDACLAVNQRKSKKKTSLQIHHSLGQSDFHARTLLKWDDLLPKCPVHLWIQLVCCFAQQEHVRSMSIHDIFCWWQCTPITTWVNWIDSSWYSLKPGIIHRLLIFTDWR